MARIVCISDTHGFHRSLDVPEGDVLVHAGDITSSGEISTIIDFGLWLRELPHPHKVIVPGNHDFCFDISHAKFRPEARLLLEEVPDVHFLFDVSRVVAGLKFYGSPWVPNLQGWAFFDRGVDRFERAPRDIDVLVTHGPPANVRDRGRDHDTQREHHFGSQSLLRYQRRCFSLKLHVFGHVHEAYGREGESPIIVNAASCTPAPYRPEHPPIIVDLGPTLKPETPS
jgi:predicted phosphodiesterase